MTGPLVWRDGAPASAEYGDIYYSREDGLAESRAVFLQGCGLPEAWTGRERFVVAELGFGTGLNVAALMDLWSKAGPGRGQLHIFSLEAHPLARHEAARALSMFPEVARSAQLLLDRWPGVRTGFRRVVFAEERVTLDLAVMEARDALLNWQGLADAWFLDGFAPARNPQMWREEVLDLVAARSAPGARLATFTVAGAVRRGLAARGFEVRKVAGHGRKRERLEGRLPGAAVATSTPRVAVVGAGIGGAGLSHALGSLGRAAEVLHDPASVAASGNPAALVTPAFDAGGGARAQLYAQAFAHAVAAYGRTPEAIIHRGVVQLEAEARDAARFDAIAAQALFEPGAVARLDSKAVSARLGEPAAGGLGIEDGLVIEPARVLEAWAPDARAARVVALERGAGVWRLRLETGEALETEVVALAAGFDSARLWPSLKLGAVRGQLSLAAGARPAAAAAFGGYAAPTREGLMFGATHDRGDLSTEVRPSDHDRNLGALAAALPALAAPLDRDALTGRAALRATTADRLPLAGQVAEGLWVLTGLGSRGFTTAPLLADHLAALICGAPSPLPAALQSIIDPIRKSSGGV